jgi:uncharacterized membrane protein
VSALLLTIPFSVFGNFGRDYWDSVETLFASCSPPVSDDVLSVWYNGTVNAMNAVTYACVGCIVLAVFYYILRPKEPDVFAEWWYRGRWVATFIFCFTATAVIASMTLYGQLVVAQWYVGFSSNVCGIVPSFTAPDKMRYFAGMVLGVGTLVVVWFVSFLLMV